MNAFLPRGRRDGRIAIMKIVQMQGITCPHLGTNIQARRKLRIEAYICSARLIKKIGKMNQFFACGNFSRTNMISPQPECARITSGTSPRLAMSCSTRTTACP